MTHPDNNKSDYIIDTIRKTVSEVSVIKDSYKPENVTLNPLAQQIAIQLSNDSQSPSMVIGKLRIIEWSLALLLPLLTYAFYFVGSSLQFLSLIGVGIFSAILGVSLLQITDCYQISALRRPRLVFLRIQLSILLVNIVLYGATRLLIGPDVISQSGFLAAYLISAAVFSIGRYIVSYAVRNWSRNGMMERRAVIVGGGQAAKDLIRQIEQQENNDIRICGIFDDRAGDRSPDVVAGYPKIGKFSELVEFARLTKLDMLIIALPLSAEKRLLELIRKIWILPVDIRIAAHSVDMRFPARTGAPQNTDQIKMLNVFNKPIRDWDSVAKRIFDLVFSVGALLLLWPVLLGTIIAIKATSKGPAFFIQKRYGFNNEVINVFKFRSMYTDKNDPTARNAVTKNDPRVTPVGRFIRKSSIDELPQLFNVLRGDLSLVGPRPHAMQAQAGGYQYEEIVEHYFARHKVKPGVTGWAQINGWRGEVDHDDKIKFRTAFDLYYIENWSLVFDLKILFLTPIRLLKTENAY